MAAKITFKNYPKATGLSSVGSPQQSIDCKIKKNVFGAILAPSYKTKDNKWRVSIMVDEKKPGRDDTWKWLTFSKTFDDSEEAKVWLRANIDSIIEKYPLHFIND